MAEGVSSCRTGIKYQLEPLRCRVWIVPVAFAIALGSASATAQPSSQAKAVAEAQFDEGLALMKAGNFAAACPKLENSQRVDPAVGTLLYLGECYARQGRTASAWASFREAASLASATNQGERAALARSRASNLEPQLATLRITIPAVVLALPDLNVRRNGEVVDPSLVGSNLPVDPGTSRIEVTAPGYIAYTANLDVAAGARAALAVPILARKPVESASEPSAQAGSERGVARTQLASVPHAHGPSDLPAPGQVQRLVGLVVGGTGIVGIGLGAYFGLSAMAKNRNAESASCDASVCQRASDLDQVNSARNRATASNIAFGIGTGLLVTGAILYWLSPNSSPTAFGLQPQVEKNALRIELQGRL